MHELHAPSGYLRLPKALRHDTCEAIIAVRIRLADEFGIDGPFLDRVGEHRRIVARVDVGGSGDHQAGATGEKSGDGG
jgi:hypothetical protein